MICFKVRPCPVLGSQKREKSMVRLGIIRVKRFFIPCDDTFFGELSSFNYNIATAN